MMQRRIALAAGVAALAILPAAGLAAKPAKPGKPGNPNPNAGKLSIAVKPAPIVFGSEATVSGALAAKTSGVSVALQSVAFPYTGTFRTVTAKATNSAGAVSYSVSPSSSTRYRLVAATSPPTVSEQSTLGVAFRVGLSVSDLTPRKGSLVRFSGSVTPASRGGTARLQKLTATGYKTVARATLSTPTSSSSRYSIRRRINSSGRYRVRVPGDNGPHLAGTSRVRRLTVG